MQIISICQLAGGPLEFSCVPASPGQKQITIAAGGSKIILRITDEEFATLAAGVKNAWQEWTGEK